MKNEKEFINEENRLRMENDARLLALMGSINDSVVDTVDLAIFGLNYIRQHYPSYLNKRYDIDENNDDLLENISRSKLLFDNNGQIDINRCVELVLKDIRGAKIGKNKYHDVRE